MLSGYVELIHGEAKRENSVQQHPLGTRGIDPNGNVFRYVSAGEALGAGVVVMQAAGIANHDMDLVTAATAQDATSVTVTLGGTAATLDQYKQVMLMPSQATLLLIQVRHWPSGWKVGTI